MARLTGAFVLRCWQATGRFQADDVWRIEVVRIHDGERTVFMTFDDTWAWLRTQMTRSDDHPPPKGGDAAETEPNDGPAHNKGRSPVRD